MKRLGEDLPPPSYDAGGDEDGETTSNDLSAMAGKKAAGRVLAAIESGDNAALDKALRAHYAACKDM